MEEGGVEGADEVLRPNLPLLGATEILETSSLDAPLGDPDPRRLAVLVDLARRLRDRLGDLARDFALAADRLPPGDRELLARTMGGPLGAVLEDLTEGDLERAREEIHRLGRAYAREELPLGSVTAAVQIYKQGVLRLLPELYPDPREILSVLPAVETFFYGVVTNLTVAYFSAVNQRLLQLRWGLERALQLVHASHFALEETSARLGLQDLIVPMAMASLVKYLREETGEEVEVAGTEPTAAEVCRAYLRFIGHLGINPEARHVIEELADGVRVTVDARCFHAGRCRRQLERGIPLACTRASGLEMALNWKLPTPYVATDKDLKPGESCSFCLRRVL